MYPYGQLSEAALRKAALHARIDRRRREMVVYGREAVKPLVWVDKAWERWRHISPWVKLTAIPVSLFMGRKARVAGGTASRLIRWVPVVTGLVRTAMALRPQRQRAHTPPQPPVTP